VGFSDKLRLCNLLVDDIRPYREFSIKGCRECSFSNGGKYFAAVNGPVIQVYNMYTCENVGNCRGHGGKVTGIAFSSDDKRLLSTGLDGAVYEWSLSTFQREKENVIKSNEYASVAVAPDDTYVFAVGSDATLKQLDGEDLMLNEEFALTGVGGGQTQTQTQENSVNITPTVNTSNNALSDNILNIISENILNEINNLSDLSGNITSDISGNANEISFIVPVLDYR